jgi:hypothetical protein
LGAVGHPFARWAWSAATGFAVGGVNQRGDHAVVPGAVIVRCDRAL